MGPILGLSCFYHDAAAALVSDGKILAAAQEERFSRIKNDPSFPLRAVEFCLEEEGLTLSDIESIVFYDKPFLKMERIFQTHLDNAPRGFQSFLTSVPSWMGEKFNFKKLIKQKLKALPGTFRGDILFSEHHLSHGASSFYTSPFSEAAALTIDGVGEWATLSISKFEGAKVTLLREMRFPDSVGLLYSAFTYYCGFKVNSGEYKLMGLAPYGHRDSERTARTIALIKENVVTVHRDGSISLNRSYFPYERQNRMIDEARFEKLFGLPRRTADGPLPQEYCDMALAIQTVTEEIVLKLARHTREITDCPNLCLAGGVALNCVANGKILAEKIFDSVWAHPAAGDAGGAPGAALAYYYSQDPDAFSRRPSFSPYLGPWFSDKEVSAVLKKGGRNRPFPLYEYKKLDRDDELLDSVATSLFEGKVCGWFQGRMEWGPRALGNRSILADPSRPEMQRKLNLKIKFRESFRPFAPVVLEERAHEYFEGLGQGFAPSPYMLFTYPVACAQRTPDEEGPGDKNQGAEDIPSRLRQRRSTISAVTHVDYSARVQTVSRTQNPKLYDLICAFSQKSGLPMLINTSFNVRGEPIVCTPTEALNCFLKTDMDILVMNNYVVSKKDLGP
ncbi:MAG: hypothetical protein OXB88_11620 [Bacteriovoracales bacterium]|nr:hypothetical protein [Bacteriovoracales bacterium]